MRALWIALLSAAGCNQLLGLDTTTQIEPICEVLPFDRLRYVADSQDGNAQSSREACRDNWGMELAVIDVNDLAEIAQELDGGSLPFWLGVSYDGNRWVGADACEPALAWAPGEPGIPQLGDCVVQTAAGMVSHSCGDAMLGSGAINVLCETPRPDEACLQLEAHSTYVVASTTPVDYATAFSTCNTMGMHLVEINSSDELQLIQTNYAATLASFWLAAQNTMTGFASATGCPQVFDWSSHFPVINTGACIVHGASGAYITQCYDLAAVICELNTMM